MPGPSPSRRAQGRTWVTLGFLPSTHRSLGIEYSSGLLSASWSLSRGMDLILRGVLQQVGRVDPRERKGAGLE
jgi:hypothetical protein